MVTDKRKGWLAELTVGSLVIVYGNYGKKDTGTVEKITPSGRIVVNGIQFNSEGGQVGSAWRGMMLGQATPENVAKVVASRSVRALMEFTRKSDADALTAFIATLTDEQRKMLGVL